MKKLFFIVAVLAALALMGGCASQQYEHYAKANAEIAKSEAEAAKARLEMLSQAMGQAKGNEAVQGMLALALALNAIQHQPRRIEQAKPGPIEQGIGSAIPAAVRWGGLVGMMFAGLGGGDSGTTNTTNYNQSISGDGSSGVIGGGTSGAYTSPPTVVYQPPPLVVNQPAPVIVE